MTAQYLQRPAPNEYAEYYDRYAALVPETDILQVLREQLDSMRALLAAIPVDPLLDDVRNHVGLEDLRRTFDRGAAK